MASILDALVYVTNNTTLNYNVSAGKNRRIVALIGVHDAGDNPNVTGVTLDGQSASEVVQALRAVANLRMEMWSILETDISTGSGLTATFSGTNIAGDKFFALVVLENCEQVAAEDTGTNVDSSTSSSIPVSPASAGAILIDAFVKRNENLGTQGADQTAILNIGYTGEGGHVSHQNGDDGGVMSWSWAGASNFAHVAASFTDFPSLNVNPTPGVATATGNAVTFLYEAFINLIARARNTGLTAAARDLTITAKKRDTSLSTDRRKK